MFAKVSALILATLLISSPASAQRFGYPPPMGDNSRLMAQDPNGANSNFFQQGMDAIQAKNFQVAEGIFEEVLRRNPTHAEGNLMMGTVKMSLNKWEDAKKYLEVAVRKAPKNPDPKSRLGVTLIKLGDIDGAIKLRDELVKMDKSCKGTCRTAQYITGGIALIDAAMPKPAGP